MLGLYKNKGLKSLIKKTEDSVFFQYAKSELEKQASKVFIWDMDKTYLDTQFETFKDLIRSLRNKKNVPGTSSLVRAFAHNKRCPIYFVTASPPQLQKKIMKKLKLDNVFPYGAYFKDNLKNLRPTRLWRLNKHVGFKLQSLLDLRLRLSDNVVQILLGDDSELDADIYNIYTDIVLKRISKDYLKKILDHHHVIESQSNLILKMYDRVAKSDVKRIYINLAGDTDPGYYARFGKRTVATYNSFQIAIDLYKLGFIKSEGVIEVGLDIMNNYSYSKDEIASSVKDLLDRGIVDLDIVNGLLPEFKERDLVSCDFNPSVSGGVSGVVEVHSAGQVDYLTHFR